MKRVKMPCRGLLLAVALLPAAQPQAGLAQSCSWGGTSTVPPPITTYLRSWRSVLRAPGRVAVDPAGNLYVTDPTAGSVLVRNPWGRLLAVHRGLADPLGIAVDSLGTIYVGEAGSGSVSVFDAGWHLRFKLGAGDGEFALPNHLAVDPDPAHPWVYVADSAAHEIKVYSQAGVPVARFGGLGTAAGRLDFPTGLYVSAAGEVFVADQNNDRVQVFDRSGRFLRCFGRRGTSGFTRRFGRVQGLAGDALGRIYLADAFQGQVKVFDANGVALAGVGSFGDSPGELQLPAGLAIDGRNRLFVASTGNGQVDLFGVDGYSDPVAIAAEAKLVPAVLTRKPPENQGQLYVLIEIPGHAPGEVVATTVQVNGVAVDHRGADVVDRDGDGLLELRVRLDRQSLLATLPDGESAAVVNGELLDGTAFEGIATVTVKPQEPVKTAALGGKGGAQ